MRIEWIEVENFKGFDKRRFEFDEHFTLIVGENGAGKTTVVSMVCQVLLAWADSFAGRGADPDNARQLLRINTAVLPSGRVSEYVLPLRLGCEVVHQASQFPCEGSIQRSETAETLQQDLRNGPLGQIAGGLALDGLKFSKVYPVCTCYPAMRDLTAEKPDYNQIMAAKPFRHDGYSNWNNVQSPSGKIAEWMGRQQMIASQDTVEATSYAAVGKAMTAALPDSKSVSFSTKEGELVVEWNSGRRVRYSILSDGQRAILTLVGDIARRAALLNPHLNDPTSETPGVVVIDEIDLHLHPRWQRRIMKDLRRVFPKIQFIATTHSPIIISAAKDAKVIVLNSNGSHELGQAYGLDVNSVVEDVQGGESRDEEVKAMFANANDFVEQGRLADARAVTAKIRKTINGPDRELVELDTMLDNFEALAHAPD